MTTELAYRPIKNNGSKHGAAKWTEDAVLALRREYDELVASRGGRTRGCYAELHRRHPEMSRQSIEFIIQRKTWRHI